MKKSGGISISGDSKKRIEFIDLAKGICILLIVVVHCGVAVPIPGFAMWQMPLFFILSGLFYKDNLRQDIVEGGVKTFVVKKLNRILIPFIFFYLISYIPFYAVNYLSPRLIVTEAKGLSDLFFNRQFFNGPIWFLLCLFWINIYLFLIRWLISNEYYCALLVFVIGALGIVSGLLDIILPLFTDVAMSALPYFYIGFCLANKTALLQSNEYDRYNLLILAACYAVTCFVVFYCNDPYFSFHYNKLHGNPIAIYLGATTGVIAVLLFCKIIKRLPLVSFWGRYSIIILCTHHLIYRPIKVVLSHFELGAWTGSVVVAATIAVCLALIPLCKKYIPYFVGQKDLIKVTKYSDG